MNRRGFLTAVLVAPFAGWSCREVSIVEDSYPEDVYVSSLIGKDRSNRGSRKLPYATVDYAISQCTSDIPCAVIIMAGHTETVTGPKGFEGWSAVKPYTGQ